MECRLEKAPTGKLGTVKSYFHFMVLFCVPFLLIVLLISLLEAIYVLIPYINAVNFLETSCTVVKIQQNYLTFSCSGGSNLFSPCIKIYVNYSTGPTLNNDSQQTIGVLMENEQALFNCDQCSFTFGTHGFIYVDDFDCGMWMESFNRSSCVEKYLLKYGQYNKTYSCLFNPRNHKQVIRTFSTSLFFILFSSTWIFFLCLGHIISFFIVSHLYRKDKLRKKLLRKRQQQKNRLKRRQDLKKKRLNQRLGLHTCGRPPVSGRHNNSYENETVKSNSLVCEDEGDNASSSLCDFRHLDLAVTLQNIDDLVSSRLYLGLPLPSTLPRIQKKGSAHPPNPLRATTFSAFNCSASVSSNLVVHLSSDQSDDVNSITTPNMLTEFEVDSLFNTATCARRSMNARTPETAV